MQIGWFIGIAALVLIVIFAAIAIISSINDKEGGVEDGDSRPNKE